MYNRGTLKDKVRKCVVEKYVKVEQSAFVKAKKEEVEVLLQRFIGLYPQK